MQLSSPNETPLPLALPKRRRIKLRWVVTFLCIASLGAMTYALTEGVRAPADFAPETLVKVTPGMPVVDLGYALKDAHVIRSPFLFQTFSILFEKEASVVAGEYQFDAPLSLFGVIKRVSSGDFGRARITVRLPEGESLQEYTVLLDRALKKFDAKEFLSLMERREGYVFPDTYYFFPSTTTKEVIETINKNFQNRTKKLQEEILKTNHSLDDIIIMASIIEKEATRDPEEQKVISGILWRRIEIGMPLQVDATFKYYLDKTSRQVTRKDITTDHPYNTYVRKGLPPGPIGNPSLQTLEAAAFPTETAFLYYLHGNDSTAHYAQDYATHLKNKKLYLK